MAQRTRSSVASHLLSQLPVSIKNMDYSRYNIPDIVGSPANQVLGTSFCSELCTTPEGTLRAVVGTLWNNAYRKIIYTRSANVCTCRGDVRQVMQVVLVSIAVQEGSKK